MFPKRIIVMRHAESEEDVDKTVYAHTPDLEVDLSQNGKIQSREVAIELLKNLSGDNVHFYLSPGLRLRNTYEILVDQFPKSIKHSFSVETLLLKQFWGDVTVENRREIEIARYREGILNFRFPNGESGQQLVDRIKLFTESMRAGFKKENLHENIVILTHGFNFRVFMTVWFGWNTDYLEKLANPKSCEMAILSLHKDGSYLLGNSLREYNPKDNPRHVERK